MSLGILVCGQRGLHLSFFFLATFRITNSKICHKTSSKTCQKTCSKVIRKFRVTRLPRKHVKRHVRKLGFCDLLENMSKDMLESLFTRNSKRKVFEACSKLRVFVFQPYSDHKCRPTFETMYFDNGFMVKE